MSGRNDYEERKQKRIEMYQELSEKAIQKSQEHWDNRDKIANAIPSRTTYFSRSS